MEDGGFARRENKQLASLIFGDICCRCASVPCECGTPEFEAFVSEELDGQHKSESLMRGDEWCGV